MSFSLSIVTNNSSFIAPCITVRWYSIITYTNMLYLMIIYQFPYQFNETITDCFFPNVIELLFW
eukprot:UN04378